MALAVTARNAVSAHIEILSGGVGAVQGASLKTLGLTRARRSTPGGVRFDRRVPSATLL
ncbi:hypothetical protein NBRC3280_1772 [Acetobacter pasteurianus NBRC 3280]|uniref:Uncharacterized protein n=1 Tax=Acetobacter pasteurianus NBRC 3278 TaxID=1226660 RepID=A0A401X500_ACEPA|nr:hypothetical protein NBRC3277_1847 [Acetobacter pasteurianus NBRC 3277]GCD62768.1 hypothetical protein NBRC3278_1861 [Acetobacter pasteurianus NBRC 3278]GCD69137.1 hypothetical protein NBRC3280_1772 [Acetobacter pasteurianus NBRC 3280]